MNWTTTIFSILSSQMNVWWECYFGGLDMIAGIGKREKKKKTRILWSKRSGVFGRDWLIDWICHWRLLYYYYFCRHHFGNPWRPIKMVDWSVGGGWRVRLAVYFLVKPDEYSNFGFVRMDRWVNPMEIWHGKLSLFQMKKTKIIEWFSIKKKLRTKTVALIVCCLSVQCTTLNRLIACRTINS